MHSWGKSKLKEADNILNSWTASVEKTVKHFCTTANRVKEDVVEFVKNIDWKKVAVGVGVTMAFTGVVLLSGGSAAPVLLSAAIGSGSGAVFNGVLTAMNGGSIADIAESASDGFMWGGIGGSLGGSTTVLLSELAAAGSSLIGNPFFQRLVQGVADTAVDTAQSASKGLPVTPEGIVVDMVYNTLMAGGIGSGGKQAVNEAVDETADSIGDSVRREVKSGSASDNYTYRALNQKDYERYTSGLGLEAKNLNGDWNLKEHLVNGSGRASWANDPYISTTSDLSVAKGFNQSGSGYGIVKIDMNKVTSTSYKGYEIYPRVNGVEGLPYHYSVWQQETSVYQSIPFEAIVDYFK